MKRVFRTGRYANVTATLALVVALGGTSYAAGTLAKNSIGSSQLKRGAVANSDLRANAVTSGKVKNGALLLKDFKTGQIPAGARGATGPTGATGATGQAGPFVDTLPSGKSLKGSYMMRGTAAAASARGGADISFGIPLAAAPTGHFLASGAAATPECPGSAAAPTAAAGHLCIYEGFNDNMTVVSFQDPVTTATGSTTRPYGVGVVGLSIASGSFISSGAWAVTAP
jgi:hypothetical protein